MADTFQTSKLPGALHHVPNGQVCDNHQDRQATRRVQGETDSFGCEVADFCEECYQKDLAERKQEDRAGKCDWCKQTVEKLRKARDYDEGLYGPVYDVCSNCIDKQHAEALAYLNED